MTITPANGDNLFYGGFELVNGTINLTASGYVMPRGDMTIGAGGVLNIPGANGKTQGSFCMSMPAVGDTVTATDGETGIVSAVNILRETMRVVVEKNDEKEVHDYHLRDITDIQRKKKNRNKKRKFWQNIIF